VNGRPVGDTTTMLNLVAALRPGEQARVRVARNLEETDLTVTIGRRPKPKQRKA
jgi:serine protease DegQ